MKKIQHTSTMIFHHFSFFGVSNFWPRLHVADMCEHFDEFVNLDSPTINADFLFAVSVIAFFFVIFLYHIKIRNTVFFRLHTYRFKI